VLLFGDFSRIPAVLGTSYAIGISDLEVGCHKFSGCLVVYIEIGMLLEISEEVDLVENQDRTKIVAHR